MIEKLYECFLKSSGVNTDTRTIKEGDMFFALRGDNFDGNMYASLAIENGARFVVVDDEEYATGLDNCFVVDDALVALQQLASKHRQALDIPVIGLTGSNGKTTSKELLVSVLKQNFNVAYTKGNLNNHIGVPLTLLSFTQEHEIAVVEMGANHVGEIGFLSSIAQPTMGFITNIGRAHLEGFGGVEGIKKGKSELYKYLASGEGLVFYDSSDEVITSLVPSDVETFDVDLKELTLVGEYPFVVVRFGDNTVSTKLTGGYNFNNIKYAVAVASYLGVESSDILKGVASYEPTNNRSQIITKESNTYILDHYNANPSSMKLSIENMLHVDEDERVLILGDMKEMGEYEASEHQEIASLVTSHKWKAVYTVGSAFFNTELPMASKFLSTAELKSFLNTSPLVDSTILLKGSRSIALEQLLD